MAIIYSYPTVVPTTDDLVLGTDVNAAGQPTKNFSIASIINLIQGGATGLGATITSNPSAQDVNGVNQSAINFLNLSGTGSVTFTSFNTLAGIQITGTVGTGFTSLASTAIIATSITGTLQTVAQPNVTSLGILTSLRIGNAAPAVTSIKTTMVSPGSDLALVTEKAIAAYIATKPNPETLAETLANGNITDGTDIAVSAGDDVTFTDTSKALFGAAPDLEIFHNGTHNFIQSKTATAGLFIQNEDANIILRKSTSTDPAESGSMAKFLTDGAVELYFNASKKFETSNVGVSVTGAVAATGSGTFVDLLNVGTYQDTSGDVGTAGQILSSIATGTNWIDVVAQYTWKIEGDTINAGVGSQAAVLVPTGSTIDFRGIGNVNTDYDTTSKELRINLVNTPTKGSGSDSQVTYWGTGANLEGDSGFTFLEGDNHLRLFADGAVAGSGIVGAAYLTTYTGATVPIPAASPQWTAGVMTSMTSITSTTFIADALASVTNFQGNASSATRLGTTNGTITLAAGVPATLGVTSDAVIYTSGGNITLNTILADSTVTGKLLTGVSFLTGTTVLATDTILVGVGKLQKQITDLPAGLDFITTWDASPNGTNTGGTPDLTDVGTHIPGQYYIVSVAGDARPNGAASQPSEWKIGDWCIRGDNTLPSAERWQKIDNTSEVTTDGSGTANVIPKWNSASQLGASQIQDLTVASRTVTTIVDGGTGGDLTVQGNTILGNAVGDTILAKGTSTFEQVTRLNLGLSANGSEGSATQVLTSGGAGTAMSWESPTVGEVTSITAGTGITIGGTAAVPTVAVDYLGTDNFIAATPGVSSNNPNTGDTMVYSESSSGAASNNVKKLIIGNLPFNNYSWKVGDSTATTNAISNTEVLNFVGTEGINTALFNSASYANGVSVKINRVGIDNAIAGLTAATAAPGDFMWFSDIDDSNTLRKSTLANLPFVPAVSGTQYTIPMFATSSTLDNSIISQNSGATEATISGDLNITGIYKKAGSQIALNDLSNAKTEFNSVFLGNIPASLDVAGGNSCIIIGYRAGNALTSGDNNVLIGKDAGLAVTAQGDNVFIGAEAGVANTLGSNIGIGSAALEASTNSGDNVAIGHQVAKNLTTGSKNIYIGSLVVAGAVDASREIVIGNQTTGNGSNTITLGDSVSTDFFGGKNGINIGSAAKPWGDLYVDDGFFDGNLTVDGTINHGGGGGGTAKGGTFTKLYTTGDIGVDGIAFTIERATSGSMVFDVMLTSDNSNTVTIAKKFTVVNQYGNNAPIFNKILDTGPDSASDFAVAFAIDGTGQKKIKCTITPAGMDTQKIGITIDLGFGQHNATVVMNA